VLSWVLTLTFNGTFTWTSVKAEVGLWRNMGKEREGVNEMNPSTALSAEKMRTCRT